MAGRDFKVKLLTKILTLYFLVAVSSCGDEEIKTFKEYEGPLMEGENVTTFYTDSAVLKIKLFAKKQWEHQNKDREFPEGMKVDFHENDTLTTTQLTANYGYFYDETGLYKVTGNVIINNHKKKETLKTEELFWKPDEERIYTDKFVRIETPKEILEGNGLEAKEDFSSYKIKDITAILTVDDL